MKIEITNREESMTIGVSNLQAPPGDKPEALAPGDRRTFEVANENGYLIIGELGAMIADAAPVEQPGAPVEQPEPELGTPVEHEQLTAPATGEE
jgi:hypothetical protein